MREWPLVGFTVAIQLSCGLALAATACESAGAAADSILVRPLAAAVFPVAAAGILLSMAHLGRPLASWRALANVRRSRLSREVLITAVFALFALAYSGSWWMERTAGRSALGTAASVAGVAAVLAAAAIYMVPAQPAWNSAWVPASFLGTTLLLGGLAPALLVPARPSAGFLRLLLGAALAGSALLALAAVRTLVAIRCTPAKHAALVCHLALVVVLPVAIAFGLWPEQPAGFGSLAVPAFAAVLFGAAIGRALMYSFAARHDRF